MRRQKGQAMLEYALITATVVMGFAAASALVPSAFWTNNLDDVRNKDYLVLPDSSTCGSFNACVNTIGDLNTRIEYR